MSLTIRCTLVSNQDTHLWEGVLTAGRASVCEFYSLIEWTGLLVRSFDSLELAKVLIWSTIRKWFFFMSLSSDKRTEKSFWILMLNFKKAPFEEGLLDIDFYRMKKLPDFLLEMVDDLEKAWLNRLGCWIHRLHLCRGYYIITEWFFLNINHFSLIIFYRSVWLGFELFGS